MTLYDLYDLADSKNIEVDAFELNTREAISVQNSNGDCCIAIDPYKLISYADEKTKLGHEMGHCMRNAFYCASSKFDTRQRQENRADKWAIHNLVPRKDLELAVSVGCTEVWDLADYFGVTEKFMVKAIHFYKEGYIS